MAGKREQKSPRRGRRSWPRTLLLLVVILGAVYAGIHCFVRAPEQHREEQQEEVQETLSPEEQALAAHMERKDKFYTILVSGLDNHNGGSDTNILVAVDAGGGKIHGVSIPRDTKAVVEGQYHKINYAYNHGGVEGLAEEISRQLGIPVDYTVQVDLDAFAALVDEIGGVTFNVPVNMNYDDPYQDLSIHIRAGVQKLNGKDAMKVVRFRHNNDGTGYGNEDLGRMKTQQEFLKAVAAQTLTPSNLGKVKEFAGIFNDYVKTDLTMGNLVWLGTSAISMGAENITFSTLPGEWKSPYIYLDQDAVLTLINESLNPYVEDRTAEDLNIPD